MKQMKRLFILALCCLILCQTTLDINPINSEINTLEHHDRDKHD